MWVLLRLTASKPVRALFYSRYTALRKGEALVDTTWAVYWDQTLEEVANDLAPNQG